MVTRKIYIRCQYSVSNVQRNTGIGNSQFRDHSEKALSANRSMNESIIIGADHAGFPLKEGLKGFLAERGLDVVDVGTYNGDPVDYPDFGRRVAESVSSGSVKRGILVCGSGVGMSITANRFPGVRGGLCLDEDMARLSRMHNDSNVLILAGRKTDIEAAKGIVKTWLETDFEGGRHQARLDKITEIERQIIKNYKL
jgi:ribose 5-phosphate isomerase B